MALLDQPPPEPVLMLSDAFQAAGQLADYHHAWQMAQVLDAVIAAAAVAAVAAAAAAPAVCAELVHLHDAFAQTVGLAIALQMPHTSAGGACRRTTELECSTSH